MDKKHCSVPLEWHGYISMENTWKFIRNSFSSFHIHIDILANDHFFSLGLIAPPNLVVIAALLVADVSMTAAILLTLELDQLYGGLVHIWTEPLKMALEQFQFVDTNNTPKIEWIETNVIN